MEKSAEALIAQLNATDEQERIEAKSCQSGNPGKAVRKTVIAFSNEPGLEVDIRQPLVRAVDQATRIVVDELPVPFALDSESLQRTDQPAIPPAVVREAVANAVMHRSYRKHAPVYLVHYDDRLEVHNPGHSLKPRTQLQTTGSALRNPTIGDVLRDTRLAENKGSGIQAMRRQMRDSNRLPPTFRSRRRGDKFVATFLFRRFPSDRDRAWLEQLESVDLAELDDRVAILLVYLRETGQLQVGEAIDLTASGPVETHRMLEHLSELGLLRAADDSDETYLPGPELEVKEASETKSRKGLAGFEGKSRKEDGKPRKYGESSREDLSDGQSEEVGQIADALEMSRDLVRRIRNLGGKADRRDVRELVVEACSAKPLSTGQLAELFDRTRDHLVREHVRPLLEAGDLERTHPDTPRHPNQRYYATGTNSGTDLHT